jgi:hypothetical protein
MIGHPDSPASPGEALGRALGVLSGPLAERPDRRNLLLCIQLRRMRPTGLGSVTPDHFERLLNHPGGSGGLDKQEAYSLRGDISNSDSERALFL